ncbi:MAG: hypothetical protein CL902_11315 [Dehalococcoidia bacterium]|nr:hypothetical protein [Dehalococcoidia bacterium]
MVGRGVAVGFEETVVRVGDWIISVPAGVSVASTGVTGGDVSPQPIAATTKVAAIARKQNPAKFISILKQTIRQMWDDSLVHGCEQVRSSEYIVARVFKNPQERYR